MSTSPSDSLCEYDFYSNLNHTWLDTHHGAASTEASSRADARHRVQKEELHW